MIYRFEKEEKLCFTVIPPLYLPFFNLWGQNAYSKYEPFSLDPFTVRAASTSGSPVVLAGEKFFGFLNTKGGAFAYDGAKTLTVTGKAGQELYVDEHCDPFDAWRGYNKIVLGEDEYKPEPFWSALEYCTWVDQKREAEVIGAANVWEPLNEDFVYRYMERVDRLGLPKGKLTIDDGWDVRFAPDGSLCYGNWQIDRTKFPHMERLVSDMKAAGFIPGLWFAPFTATPNSILGKEMPHLLGGPFGGSAESESARKLMLLLPDPCLEEYYRELFMPYVSMGFKKFKLDMSYGPKHEMTALLKMIRDVIKKMDPTIELEGHIPDIFTSRFSDTVRINDVMLDEAGLWRGVTTEHYRVCRFSSADRILNLDHLGTNQPSPKEEAFMEHVRLLTSFEGGYPCVSLLPDRFSQKTQEEFCELVRRYDPEKRALKEKETKR